IPTSRNGGADPGFWFNLNGTGTEGSGAGTRPYVTWSTSTPGCDPDGVFSLTAGATYGLFIVPTTAIYNLDAIITFDSGTGVHAGSGLPAAPLPSGMAIRQGRMIVVSGTDAGTVLSTLSRQVVASNS